MRTVKTEEITAAVAQMCKEAAYYLPKDVYEALKKVSAQLMLIEQLLMQFQHPLFLQAL